MTSDQDKKPCKHINTRCPGMDMGLSCHPPCNHYEPGDAGQIDAPITASDLGIEPTDAQLDAFVATEVMGWVADASHVPRGFYRAVDGRIRCVVRDWHPSTDIAQAFRVQAAVPEEQRAVYASRLLDELGYEGPTTIEAVYAIATASPRQRCLALYRMAETEADLRLIEERKDEPTISLAELKEELGLDEDMFDPEEGDK